ncbi:MAG TPA: penicillin-binding transpeptidase domain-containing protein [Longimicrobiaceae bacterium]|nr:penicillin-binding transpeptidase domain-containing protein [Longimicrobiaceae bacterium]
MRKGVRRRARDSGPNALTPRRRVLLGGLVLAALLIVARAIQLQAIEGERWAGVAADQQRARMPLPARRGGIFDRHGTPLALSHETYRVAVAPRELTDAGAAQQALVEVLGLTPAEAQRATERERRWVVIPGRFSAQQRQQLGRMRGVHFERRLERFYPQGDVGREVIGAVTLDGRALGGIEQQFDVVLRGEPGSSVLRRDARGEAQPTISLPVVAPMDGADIYLTIDFHLQEIADGALREAMRATGASGGDLLIMDPHTGELLAAVSRRRGSTRSLTAITEPYEPGSTLKPLLVAALLAAGRASLSDSVDGEQGSWQMGGRTIRDVHGYGMMSLHDALRVSSNIGIIKLTGRLLPGEQFAYLRDFGLGTPTGVEYPAESGGRLRRPAQWSAMSAASLAMGYEIAVTPLQLLAAYGALANGGVLMEPRLLREVRDSGGENIYELRPQPVRRVLPAEVTQQLTEVLISVVEEGTATRASLGSLAVAGKTGTARRTGAGGRYESGSYTSSFIGYFPARDPQLALLVKLDQPQGTIYGGLTAAPVTRETLQAILATRTSTLSGRGLVATRAEGAPAQVQGRHVRGNPASGSGGPFIFFLGEEVPEVENGFPARQVPVPDLTGLPLRDAVRRAHALGLQVRLEGSGAVERSEPAAGTLLPAGDTLRLIGRDG